MPLVYDEVEPGQLALREGLDLGEETQQSGLDVLGAAFRQENPVVSALTGFSFDHSIDRDPEYRSWDEVQGTKYEPYADRLANSPNAEQTALALAQIDREIEDKTAIHEAGAWGNLAGFSAAILSPTSLLPGGAVVKGAKGGVSIGKTAMTVSGANAAAIAIDELALHSSQQTRTGAETVYAIGGGVLLGGLLGAAVGKMSPEAFKAASHSAERLPEAIHDIDSSFRSVGAAENTEDFSLRKEKLFSTVRNLPVVGRPIMGTDPLLRSMLHDFQSVRAASARLAEPILEYEVNSSGKHVLSGRAPVETRIKTRRNNELAGLHAEFVRNYANYAKDGPVGLVGHFTAPVTGKWSHLFGYDRKLSSAQFAEEVAKALRRDDKHPISQVQKTAAALRTLLFEPTKKEAEELGIFPEGMRVKNAGSYLSRIYNTEKITRHLGDGSSDDILPILEKEFAKKRSDALQRLELDKSLSGALSRAMDDIEYDEFLAAKSDIEIKSEVEETVRTIRGLAPGQHAYQAVLSKPSRTRVLDVPDEVLEPWLESDARVIMTRYFETLVPDFELIREFGDIELSGAIQKINEEETRLTKAASSSRKKKQVERDANAARRDILAMKERIRGTYMLPSDPRNVWVAASRVSRTLSYTGLLGGFTISAMPDLGKVVGEAGVEAAFGSFTALTDPKRMKLGLEEASELGAAAEWYLNGRAMEIANLVDPFSSKTRGERIVGEIGRTFSYVAGIVPWNAGWKTVGGAFVASRMSKAAVAMASGKATQKQTRFLAANGIEPWMADRIAKQVQKHGDLNGTLWLAQGRAWDDKEAFRAFNDAMTREFDLMVPTPNQDRPLTFSSEAGKFFFQFKTFAFSAYHRILLASIQKADGDALASVVTMLALSVMVSHIKSDLGGYERKEGVALWEDALDRSGLAGWLMEVHAPANALLGGALSLSGEEVSRYRTRGTLEGLLGPSMGLAKGVGEGVAAASRAAAEKGQFTEWDRKQMLRAVPGNNLWYLMPLFQKIELQT
ncbi:hypothetical protein [Cognatishimia activa]|uniref:Large polyvalent protein associated domain-containing protein n=1 Tax=Cognatishimia activa TaxID=1715691 RepID=A0A975I696_9RHOB|nr:hypothetical protein [Cognatishimia activa]QTN34674.1 hypothetical protein HZ995_09135 [Cognatishimia activa]